jgi:hypothetical protein
MILLMVFSRTQKSPNKIGAFGLPVHGTGLKFLSVTCFRSYALSFFRLKNSGADGGT